MSGVETYKGAMDQAHTSIVAQIVKKVNSGMVELGGFVKKCYNNLEKVNWRSDE